MRVPVLLLMVAAAVAGCIEADLPDGAGEPPLGTTIGSVSLNEHYNGTVLGVHVPMVILLSPDQLGDVERWFWVHENTTELSLELDAEDELYMYVLEPDCHDWDCAHEVATSGGAANITFEQPQTGGWEVVFFKQEPGAAEIDYSLKVTKNQTQMHDIEHEVYPGSTVGAHTVVFWISPDQLGDVFREFYVHEGTETIHFNVTSDADFQFVLGQSNPSRDGSSEEYYPLEDGHIEFTIEDPHIGGWYFIAFPPEEPGVHTWDYVVEITKHQG